MLDASCLISVALTMAVAIAAGAQRPAGEPPLCPPPAVSTADGDGLLGWPAVPLARSTTAPRLIRQHKPQYTAEAMRAGVEGTVLLQTLVSIDGIPSEICVVRSLDGVYGLDAQAADALAAWRFNPGTADGVPVPVHVTVELGFSLGRGAPQVARRTAAQTDGVFYDEPAHGFRVTLLPVAGLVERETRCFIPVPPERRAHVAQTMVVYVQPTRSSADERESTPQAAAASEPWLVVLDSGDGHVIFDQTLGDCRDAPSAGPAVSLLREQPATTPRLIKAGDFNTTGAIKPGDKGHVEVEFTVLPDGRTADLRISRSVGAQPAVEAAALAAGRTTTYEPATKGGLPVAVRTTLSWGFQFM